MKKKPEEPPAAVVMVDGEWPMYNPAVYPLPDHSYMAPLSKAARRELKKAYFRQQRSIRKCKLGKRP